MPLPVNPDGELMCCTACGHITDSTDGLCDLCGGEGDLPNEDEFGDESDADVSEDESGYQVQEPPEADEAVLDATCALVDAAVTYVDAIKRQDSNHRAERKHEKPWAQSSHDALVRAVDIYEKVTK